MGLTSSYQLIGGKTITLTGNGSWLSREETEEEMKARHERELSKLKEEREKELRDDKLRRERNVCDFIERDLILHKINDAISLIEENGNGQKTTELKKAYNNRLDEIAKVMMNLKK